MAGFLWGLGIGFVVGGTLVSLIWDALTGDDDGFCHCLKVRNERSTTDGICDTCGRMVDPYELDPTRSVTVLTERCGKMRERQ